MSPILCAVAAVCYHLMLIKSGKPLSGLHYRLSKWERDLRHRMGYGLYCTITHSLRACVWCLAGQLAVLHYVVTEPLPCASVTGMVAYLLGALFDICTAILSSAIILHYTDNAIENSR